MSKRKELDPVLYDALDVCPAYSVLEVGRWHRWFAWRPIFVTDIGTVWLRTVDRRFSVRTWPDGTKAVSAEYREGEK